MNQQQNLFTILVYFFFQFCLTYASRVSPVSKTDLFSLFFFYPAVPLSKVFAFTPAIM